MIFSRFRVSSASQGPPPWPQNLRIFKEIVLRDSDETPLDNQKIYKDSDFDPDIACDIVRDNLEDLSLALPKTNWWLFLENGATSQQVWAKNPTWLISHTFYRREAACAV